MIVSSISSNDLSGGFKAEDSGKGADNEFSTLLDGLSRATDVADTSAREEADIVEDSPEADTGANAGEDAAKASLAEVNDAVSVPGVSPAAFTFSAGALTATPSGDGSAEGQITGPVQKGAAQPLTIGPAFNGEVKGLIEGVEAQIPSGIGVDAQQSPEDFLDEVMPQAAATNTQPLDASKGEFQGREELKAVETVRTESNGAKAEDSSGDPGGLTSVENTEGQDANAQWNGREGAQGQRNNETTGGDRHSATIHAGNGFKELVDMPARTSPAAAVDSFEELKEKLNAGIRISVQNGGGEVRMRLNPENLGELVIKLNIVNDDVVAEILADNLEVKRAIETDASVLKEALGANGLNLKECVIGISRSAQCISQDQGGMKEQLNGGWQDRDGEGRGRRFEEEELPSYRRDASSGRIDIFA